MLYAIVAVIAIILDQVVKYVVESRVPLDAIGEDVVRLIPGFVHVTNVHNYGAAFSFLEGARWFFVILCIIFVLVVVYVLAKDIINTPIARWLAIFVLAGAVGNCIDRIVCGYVVDMFEFEFFRFPVFNVADIYITCGAIAFCLCVLLEKPKKAAPAGASPAVAAPAQPVSEKKAVPAKEKKPAAAKKPLIRKHQKVEVPNFPKHEPAPAAPAIDPNDPFAEWEKRANAPKAAPTAPAQSPAHVVYTQPAAAEVPAAPAAPAQPAAPVAPVALVAPAEPVVPTIPAAPVVPAQPTAPAASAVPAQPAAPAPAAEEPETYNLDDILAEFRDL